MGDEAYKALYKLSNNSQQWDFSSCRDKSIRAPKKGGIYEIKEEIDLRIKTNAFTKKVDALTVSKSIIAPNTFNVDSCSICASSMHLAHSCPSSLAFVEFSMEQVNNFNDFRKQLSGPYLETYNPWRNHPNFSWKQNQPVN
jgi:hypothetical protein